MVSAVGFEALVSVLPALQISVVFEVGSVQVVRGMVALGHSLVVEAL